MAHKVDRSRCLLVVIVVMTSAVNCTPSGGVITGSAGIGNDVGAGGASNSPSAGGSSAKASAGSSGNSVGGNGSGGAPNSQTGGVSSTGTGNDKNSTGGDSSAVGGTTATGGRSASSTGGMSALGGSSSTKTSTGGNGSGSTGGKSGMSTGGMGATGGSSNRTGTGGTSSPGGTSAVSGNITISGLKVDPNPNNVLSAYVSWTTNTAADSVVQFGEGSYQWEITDSTQTTTHKVLIIGMHASKANQIKAISSSEGSSGSATTNYTTGALPSQIPVGTIGANDTTKSQSGWTLMNIIKSSSTSVPSGSAPAAAVIYDANGQPVWYYIDGTTNDYGGAVSTALTDKGVLIGPVMNSSMKTGEPPREVDFAGNTVWQCADANCGTSDGYLSHHASKLSNGDYVSLRWITSNNNQNPIYEEYSPSNQKVWSLDFSKLVPMPSGKSGDWCHGNSITIDIANDAVYANCRWMGLIKVKYSDPTKLIWHLPASYNATGLGNMTFSPSSAQYSDTHDPEIHSDGTILLFDNGGYNSGFGTTTTTYHSRAVEYKVDESTKTATLAWEFPGTFNVDSWYKNNWYTSYFGDADRLANGNVLITAGSLSANTGDARVFEVMKTDGKVVWEFKLPSSYGVYRADRITPPLVHAVSQ